MLWTGWMLWSDIAVPSSPEGCGNLNGAKKITGTWRLPKLK